MFRLTKWYFDCTGAAGAAFLAYRAELQWRALRLHYASVLGGPTVLRRTPPPHASPSTLDWLAPALGVSGRWEALDPPACATVLDGVEWECVQPRARAEVRLNGRSLAGLGYAERLTVSLAPWQLPIAELRWGRFLGDTDGLVWIELRGPEPRILVFHNGAPAKASALAGLELEPGAVLRDGPLIDTALSSIPGAAELFPAGILRVHESKWLSRGRWIRPGLPEVSGWAIHEVVRWP